MSCGSYRAGEPSGSSVVPGDAVGIGRLLSMIKEPIRAALDGMTFLVFGDVERISEYKGSVYLTLIEKSGRYTFMLKVFVPSSVISGCGCDIKVNSKLLVRGGIGTTMLGNEVQLNASWYEDIGVGRLVAEVERWKKEYSALLARPKRSLPRLCVNVCVVSNPEVQGFIDFSRHFRYGRLSVVRRKMQGDSVAEEVASGLRSASEGNFDCVGIVRGGGSFKDLFEFNKPVLLEAIGSCRIPVVTAIGHESDVLLADVCADLSMGTPTAFGAMLSARVEDEIRLVGSLRDGLVGSLDGLLSSELSSLSQRRGGLLDRWAGLLDVAASGVSRISGGLHDFFVAVVERELLFVRSSRSSVVGFFVQAVVMELNEVSSLGERLEKSYVAQAEKSSLRMRHRKVVLLGLAVIVGLLFFLVVVLLGGRR